MRLIDADALIERLKAWDTNDTIDKALYNFALNRVLEAPTIEERKTGKWIEDGYYRLPTVCSYYEKVGDRKWKFCPMRGADMRTGKYGIKMDL